MHLESHLGGQTRRTLCLSIYQALLLSVCFSLKHLIHFISLESSKSYSAGLLKSSGTSSINSPGETPKALASFPSVSVVVT